MQTNLDSLTFVLYCIAIPDIKEPKIETESTEQRNNQVNQRSHSKMDLWLLLISEIFNTQIYASVSIGHISSWSRSCISVDMLINGTRLHNVHGNAGNYVSAFLPYRVRFQEPAWSVVQVWCRSTIACVEWNKQNEHQMCYQFIAEICANKLLPNVLIPYLCTSFLLAHIHRGKTFVIHQFTVRNFIHETFMLKPFYCVLIDC